ncbi:hypothetical protein GW17_00025080 [Ensete ventricosum]|nr:hypothetical protein GW17_00025080 [Ensete ventricosum]
MDKYVSRASQCRIEKLSALELTRRVPSEAGYTEYFDQFTEQLRCVGVAAYRRTIQPRGLLLPFFSGAPRLVYVVRCSFMQIHRSLRIW